MPTAPPAGPSWLDNGDKIASIVSAVLAVASLVVSLVQGRRASVPAGQAPARRRWRLAVTGGCAVVGIGAAAVVAWAPHGLRVAGVAVGGLAAALAIVMTGWGVVAWLRAPKSLDPAVRGLLEAQLVEADYHQYAFGSLPLPGVSLIYVEQHLGAVRSGRAATRILDVDKFVRASAKAIVIGAPGAGKSTFAAHVVGTSARWWTRARVVSRIGRAPFSRLLPVLLPAKTLADADVAHALATRWSQANVTPDMFTRPPYRRVDWLIIVDSLDEISDGEARRRVIQTLGAFLASGTRSHLIVTTRALTAGELADLTVRGAQEFHLRLFGREELQHFATRFFIARGGGAIDPVAEATRFLGHVRASGLTSIVRVPLLATMAILVYDNDRDRTLPTSRAGLYHEFIWLLRGARDLPAATPFKTWLAGNLDRLLRELAAALMRDDSLRLLPWADAWVAANAPAELLAGSEVERLGILRNSLIASGLCVFAPSLDADGAEGSDGEQGDGVAPEPSSGPSSPQIGNDVEFVHFTIAEYLAAEPSVHVFSYDEFRSLMANGRSRGFALFGLARSSADLSQVLRSLLRDDDPINAGRIIADGIPVGDDLRRQTIDALVERVTRDHPTVVDCVALLGDLAATDPDVRARLRALAVDSAQTLWARVVVADALADLDADGPRLLQDLIQQSLDGDPEAIWWARQRLAARVGSTPPPDEAAPQDVASVQALGEIGRQACLRTATDGRQLAVVRFRAARNLYNAGDRTGAEVLYELVRDPGLSPDLRLQAARSLGTGRDRYGYGEALQALALADPNAANRVPVRIRRAAANELLTQGDPAGIESLRQLARDTELSGRERRQIVDQLVERDDPLGRQLLAEMYRRQARHGILVRFAGAGLTVASLVAVANHPLLSGRRVAVVGAAFVVAAIAMLLEDGAWLPGVASRPPALQDRSVRPRPYPSRRGRTTGVAERLAAAVEEAVGHTRPVSLSGGEIQMRLAPAGQHTTPPTTLDPVEFARRMPNHPRLPVVILGPPGSGKTHLATTLVLELLRWHDADGVVPVLLPLRNWSASNRSIEAWMAESLSRDYAVPLGDVTDLVAAARILPVLDGLDEAASEEGQRRAVYEINAMARRGVPCVVTCRQSMYEQLMARGSAVEPAAVYRILPLRPQDVVEFILNNVEGDHLKAWTPVIREIEQDPTGQFAELMSSPLAATIALQPYLATGRNPQYLLRQVYSRGLRGEAPADRALGDSLDAYLDDTLQRLDVYAPEQSMRWLATIARQAQQGAVSFSWRSVQDWLPFPVQRAVAAATTVPALIAAVAGLSLGAARLTTVLATSGMLIGLLMTSARAVSGRAAGNRPSRSSAAATFTSVVMATVFAVGAALIGYAGTGRLADALVLAAAGVGSFWVTEAGRFQLSRTWLALTSKLPWSLERFLAATTRVGITRHYGAAYQFLHVMMQEHFAGEA